MHLLKPLMASRAYWRGSFAALLRRCCERCAGRFPRSAVDDVTSSAFRVVYVVADSAVMLVVNSMIALVCGLGLNDDADCGLVRSKWSPKDGFGAANLTCLFRHPPGDGSRGRATRAACPHLTHGRHLSRRIRPISALRFWISEGLTQAKS